MASPILPSPSPPRSTDWWKRLMAAEAKEILRNMRRSRPTKYRAVYVNPTGPLDEDTYQKVLRWIRGLAK